MPPRSAKALFQATKAKPRPDPRQQTLLHAAESKKPDQVSDLRRELDFYPTGQPDAIRALLAADGGRLAVLGGEVWEPAVGDGALAREMQAAGLSVIGSDVEDRGWPGTVLQNFYAFAESPARVIITNPPFSEISARDGHGRWLAHTLGMPGWRYAAFLLSWDWPAAKANGLGAMLDRQPFSYCYLMRWKLDFTGEGSPPQRNAWFVWDRDWDGREPAFRWLDRRDNRQKELF